MLMMAAMPKQYNYKEINMLRELVLDNLRKTLTNYFKFEGLTLDRCVASFGEDAQKKGLLSEDHITRPTLEGEADVRVRQILG